jgi:hypothetical protein
MSDEFIPAMKIVGGTPLTRLAPLATLCPKGGRAELLFHGSWAPRSGMSN